MRYWLKISFLATLGFFTPIAISLLIISLMSSVNEGLVSATISPTNLVEEIENPNEAVPLEEVEQQQSSFSVIKSHQVLDPEDAGTFFVSMLLRFDMLPAVGRRNNIISKYQSDTSPYPGWAIAVHRRVTSVRPEVYWRGEDGSGGWYTFDDVDFLPERWYAMTVVIAPRNFISVYLQKLAISDNSAPDGGVWHKLTDTPRAISPVIFAGGQEISGVQSPRTGADLLLGARRVGRTTFRGDIAQILVGQSGNIPTDIDQLLLQFNGGPSSIERSLQGTEVRLWIANSVRDESSFAHQIQTAG